MLCTVTLNGLASALEVVSFDPGRDFEVVTVSFEPKETPALASAKKAVYLRRYERHLFTSDVFAIDLDGWHPGQGIEVFHRPPATT